MYMYEQVCHGQETVLNQKTMICDNNRVTGLHKSYPRVIAALNVLVELVHLY